MIAAGKTVLPGVNGMPSFVAGETTWSIPLESFVTQEEAANSTAEFEAPTMFMAGGELSLDPPAGMSEIISPAAITGSGRRMTLWSVNDMQATGQRGDRSSETPKNVLVPLLFSPFFGFGRGGDTKQADKAWVLERVQKALGKPGSALASTFSQMSDETRSSLENMVASLLGLGLRKKVVLGALSDILRWSGNLDMHRAADAAPKMIEGLVAKGMGPEGVLEHLSVLSETMQYLTSSAYDVAARLNAAGLDLESMRTILAKAKKLRLSKGGYPILASIIEDHGVSIADRLLAICRDGLERSSRVYGPLKDVGFGGEDLVAYYSKATDFDIDATPALLEELRREKRDYASARAAIIRGLGRAGAPRPEAISRPEPGTHVLSPVSPLSPVRSARPAKVHRTALTLDESIERILRDQMLGAFFRKFLLLNESDDARLRVAFTDNGLDADVVDGIINIVDVISQHTASGLDGTEFDAAVDLVKLAIDKKCIKDAAEAVENAAGKKINCAARMEGKKIKTADIYKRDGNARDILSLIQVMVVLADWREVIGEYDATILAAVAPAARDVVDLVDALKSGDITVAFEPKNIASGAGASYIDEFDTVYLKDIGINKLFDPGYDESVMFQAQTVIHELVHAVQHRRRMWSETVKTEAEAHAIEMMYCLLKFDEADVRNQYRKGIWFEKDDENYKIWNRKLTEYYGEGLVAHLIEQHGRQSFRLAALDWALGSLGNITGGRSVTIPFSNIEKKYTMAHSIPIATSYYSDEDLNRKMDMDVNNYILSAEQLQSTLEQIRDVVAGYERKWREQIQGSNPYIVATFRKDVGKELLEITSAGPVFRNSDPNFDSIKFFDEIVIPMANLVIMAESQ